MQYLVHCLDRSYCVIYERSIIVENENSALDIGESIKFLWPEDSLHPKIYSGTIIAKDENEDTLLEAMTHLSKERDVKGRKKAHEMRPITTRTGEKGIKLPEEVTSLKSKPRKQPKTLLEQEIQEDINKKHPMNEPSESNWIVDLINNVKVDVNSDLQKIKTNVFTKLDFMQTSLLQKENCTFMLKESASNMIESNASELYKKATISSKSAKTANERRSSGMPNNDDDDCKQSNSTNKRNRSPEDTSKSTKKNKPTESQNNVPERNLLQKNTIDNLKITETVKRRSIGMSVIDTNNDQGSLKKHDELESLSFDLDELEPFSFENNLNNKVIPSTSKQTNVNERKSEDDFEDFIIDSPENVIVNLDESSSDLEVLCSKQNFSKKIVDYSSEEEEVKIDKENKHDQVNKFNENKKKSELKFNSKNSGQRFEKACKEESNDELANSRWTLRHPVQTSEVSELIKNSKIFVNDFEKKKALDVCKNQTELARAFMKIVFTEAALTKCSLFGKKPKGLGKNNSVRPGLNLAAIDAILLYVKRFGEKNEWPFKDRQLIIRSMAAKLNEMKQISEQEKNI